jgi:hypothetical protein
MPTELERHLVVEVVPAEMLASVLSGEEPGRFPLDQGVIAEYGDRKLVSRTFDIRDDGAAVLAVIPETKSRRARYVAQEEVSPLLTRGRGWGTLPRKVRVRSLG